MGFNNGESPGDRAVDDQINQQKAEIEQKRESIYQTKLDIIKSQAGQVWQPGGNAPPGRTAPKVIR